MENRPKKDHANIKEGTRRRGVSRDGIITLLGLLVGFVAIVVVVYLIGYKPSFESEISQLAQREKTTEPQVEQAPQTVAVTEQPSPTPTPTPKKRNVEPNSDQILVRELVPLDWTPNPPKETKGRPSGIGTDRELVWVSDGPGPRAVTSARVDLAEDDFPAPRPTPTPPRIVSGGVVNGKAINLVKPPYPPAARAVRASGVVDVQVVIDEQGNVTSASAVSGNPLLRPAAVQAARQSKFSPTMLAGQAVKVSGIIRYNFVP